MRLAILTTTGCTVDLVLAAIKRFKEEMGIEVDSLNMFYGSDLVVEMARYAAKMNKLLTVYKEQVRVISGKNVRDPRGNVAVIQRMIEGSDGVLWVDTEAPKLSYLYKHCNASMVRRKQPALHLYVDNIQECTFNHRTIYNIPKVKHEKPIATAKLPDIPRI